MKNILPPHTPGDLAGHGRRIYDLERRVGVNDELFTSEAIFSFAYPFPETSGPYYHPQGAKLVRVVCALGAAGSTSTTLRLRRNGTIVGDIVTLASGATKTVALFTGVNLAPDEDALTVELVTAGTGAENLSVLCRFGR